MWVVWILLAVCLLVLVLCLVKKLVAITLGLALCIFFGGGCEPNLHTGIDPKYGNTVAYAGWTDDERIYENALNKDILQGKDGVHLPVYKVDTLEDLAAFKDSYGDIFTMNEGRDQYLSFDGAVAKAQWDNEAFYNKYTMLVVYVPAMNGTLRVHVADVQTKNETFDIYVGQGHADLVSDEMAGWFILMEVEDEEMTQYKSFNAFLNNAMVE